MSDDRLPNRWLGFFMIAIGGMITALCGSCTLLLAFPKAWDSDASSSMINTDAPSWLILVMLVGGLPTIAGLVLLVWGLRLAGLFGTYGKKPPNKA